MCMSTHYFFPKIEEIIYTQKRLFELIIIWLFINNIHLYISLVIHIFN